MSPITILLAEEQRVIREIVRNLLQAEEDIHVIAEAENGPQAVALTGQLCPDVVIMDVFIPLINGMEATRQIKQITVHTKVLMLSSHNDAVYVEQAMASGASGYLVKQTDTLMLPVAIRSAHRGIPFFCPGKTDPSERL